MKPERRLGALVEAGMILSSELDLDSLLQRIADLAREVVGAHYAAVGVLREDDPSGELSRFVYSGIDDKTADRIGELPRGRGVLGVLIEEGNPLRLHEIADHQRSYGFPPHHPPMHTFLGVPIVVRGRIFGRLYLTEKEGGADFTKDDERIALTLASQAGIAVENAHLVNEVQEKKRDLAILEERDRIAKELHDGVIQSIYSVGLSLQGTMPLLDRDTQLAQTRIDDVIAELDSVVRDVRSYIFELRPKSVEEHGLDGAIESLVHDFRVNTLAETDLELAADACGSLNEDEQIHLVQIVREILSNIARHSEASFLRVACRMDGEDRVLTIEDDGKVYDPQTVRRGSGLHNIEARTRLLGGELRIESKDGKGMRHLVRIPAEST